MAIQNLRNAFENLPIAVKLLLGGQDVTDAVQDYGEVSFLSDDEIVGRYNPGEFRFTLLSPDEAFNPESASNFFASNSLDPSGIGVSVELQSNYGDNASTPIWSGKIVSIVFYAADQEGNEALSAFTAADLSENMDEPVVSFGTPKRFRVAPKAETQGNGIYPILKAVTPVSDQASILHLSLSEQGDLKERLRTEGDLDAKNFIVSDNGVETEGGQLTGLTTAFPQLESKFPYRYEPIGHLISEIATKFDIPQHEMVLFLADLGAHFSSQGRIGYNSIGNSGAEYDRTLSWEAFPTDRYVIGNNEYTLQTINSDDQYNKSRVLRYSHSSLEESIVYSFPAGKQSWQFAMVDDNSAYFLVRNTTDTALSFDTLVARNNSSCRIEFVNWNTNSVSTIANSGSTYRPQCATHYSVARGVNGYATYENRQGFQIYNNTHLIYRYSRGEDKAGVVARKISDGSHTVICEFTSDGHQNHMGHCFSISGNEIRVSITFRNAVDSLSEVYIYDLSTLT